MECPNCQHWNEAGARFCEECGIELPVQRSGVAQVSVSRPPANMPASPSTASAPDPVPAVSAVADGEMIPITPPDVVPAPYTGPRLVLSSTGSIFRLPNVTVIGREDPTLQIDLDGYPEGKYISHKHAQITKIAGKYFIEDLGSSNHTVVNGIRLAQGQSEPLDEGDTIQLGKIVLTFHEQ